MYAYTRHVYLRDADWLTAGCSKLASPEIARGTSFPIVFAGKVKGSTRRSIHAPRGAPRKGWVLPLPQLNLPGESRGYVVHIVGTERGGGEEHLWAATHEWPCVHVTAICTIRMDDDECLKCTEFGVDTTRVNFTLWTMNVLSRPFSSRMRRHVTLFGRNVKRPRWP